MKLTSLTSVVDLGTDSPTGRWTARVRALQLSEAIGLLPYATGAAVTVSIILVWVKCIRTPSFPYAPFVTICAVSAFATSLIVTALLRRLSHSIGWMAAIRRSDAATASAGG